MSGGPLGYSPGWLTCGRCGLTARDVAGTPPACVDPARCRRVSRGEPLELGPLAGGVPMTPELPLLTLNGHSPSSSRHPHDCLCSDCDAKRWPLAKPPPKGFAWCSDCAAAREADHRCYR